MESHIYIGDKTREYPAQKVQARMRSKGAGTTPGIQKCPTPVCSTVATATPVPPLVRSQAVVVIKVVTVEANGLLVGRV